MNKEKLQFLMDKAKDLDRSELCDLYDWATIEMLEWEKFRDTINERIALLEE